MNGNELTLDDVLNDLYASEINISIVSFWDNGYTIKLGDELNGFRVKFQVDASEAYLPHIIKTEAIKHYPNSEFAKKYKEIKP